MSARRAAASEARKLTEDDDVDDADVEMKDQGDASGSDMDAEGEADDDGSHDMFQLISDVSAYLCSVEEE